MENSTLKQTYRNMFDVIKRGNGTFFNAFILVLIPVLIITCYSFYAVYGGIGMNYSALDGFNFESLLTGSNEAVAEFQETLYKIIPESSYEQSFADVILDLINSGLIFILDAFIIILAARIIFEKNASNSLVLKSALKKLPTMIIISIFASWIIFEVQSVIYSSVFMFLASLKLSNEVFIYTSVVSTVILTCLLILLATWILLFIRYMAIAAVSGRCRFMLALGYAREILKGKVWKTMFRIMPFIVLGFIIPSFFKAFAIAYGNNVTLSIILVAVSTIVEMAVFTLMWIYTVPEFFNNEKESGIQQKIQEMIERTMNMRKNQQTEDNNNEEKKE